MFSGAIQKCCESLQNQQQSYVIYNEIGKFKFCGLSSILIVIISVIYFAYVDDNRE